MGQYYSPVILSDNKKEVLKTIYSHDFGNGLKLMEHSYLENEFVATFESEIIDSPKRIVWAGDYADEENGEDYNLYNLADDAPKLTKLNTSSMETNFLINHDKKLYVDKAKIKVGMFDLRIHPLPLLTCEGNGRGGGDYRGDSDLVGTWARDNISCSKEKPEGFEELIFDLVEE